MINDANNAAPQKRPQVSRIFGQKIVKQRFQLGFSLTLFGLMALTALTMWGYGQFIMNHLVNNGLIQQKELGKHLHVLNSALIVTGVLGLLVTYAVSMLFSHRIAGPIYRFEKVLQRMKTGDFSMQVRLRRFDEFKDVAALLNETSQYLLNGKKSAESLMNKIIHDPEEIKLESHQAGLANQESKIDQLIKIIPR